LATIEPLAGIEFSKRDDRLAHQTREKTIPSLTERSSSSDNLYEFQSITRLQFPPTKVRWRQGLAVVLDDDTPREEILLQ
jgi:hypothetical protein